MSLKRQIVGQDSHAKTFLDQITIIKRTYPGIAAGTKEEKYLSLNLKDIINENKFTKKHLKRKSKKKPVKPEDIAMSELLLPTTKCGLIQCNYFLEVHFEHKGITLGSKIPPAILPLTIVAPAIPAHLHHIQIPQNWNP